VKQGGDRIKYVIYLEQDGIDTQEKRWEKLKRKYLGSGIN